MSYTVLAFGAGLWHWDAIAGGTRYHLWTLAARGNPVIYVERPTNLNLTSKLKSADDRPFHVFSPGMIPLFSVGKIPIAAVANPWRSITSRRMAGAALSAAKSLNLDIDVCWLGAPWHSSLIKHLPGNVKTVHHVYDELTETPAYSSVQKRILRNWESEILEQSDLVVCSSMPQFKKRQKYGSKVKLLENAVCDDFLKENHNTDDPRLQEFLSLPRPRFVYGGVADHRLNPALFQALLDSPDVGSLSFLGTKSPQFQMKTDDQSRLKFFGKIKNHDFPAFYQHADVLVLGHKIIPFTESMFSAKLGEYLSSGKPIISVPLPEVERVTGGSPVVYIAGTPEEFKQAASLAAKEDSLELKEKRRQIASQRTWSTQGEKLDLYIMELLKQNA